MRQRFIVTCQPEGTNSTPALAVIAIDPQDIYQAGIDADLRALAWKSLGRDPAERLEEAPPLGPDRSADFRT